MERPAPGANITTELRPEANANEGMAYSLFEQLKHSFSRSGQKQYGHFDRSITDNPLPGWLKDQQQGQSSFARFSQRLLEHLQQQLDQIDDAFNCHLLIAIETVMELPQLYIFWVRHTEALSVDNHLEVEASRYIDTSKLVYAARLFIDEWQEDGNKYLTLVTKRGDKTLSDAFTHFIGFASGVDLVEETGEFLNIVDNYTASLPEDSSDATKQQIMEYCVNQDKQGLPVVFEDLSEQIDEKQPEAFANFVNENREEASEEIYTDRNSLKRYMRYFGRDQHISISFDASQFGEAVVYDEGNDSLVIKQIPKSLKQQLKQR